MSVWRKVFTRRVAVYPIGALWGVVEHPNMLVGFGWDWGRYGLRVALYNVGWLLRH